jgi:hypothetical protein
MIKAEGVLMSYSKYWFLVLFLLFLGCAQKPPITVSSSPIYDENADARRDVAAAMANAERSDRNIVLIFGANW